MILNIFAALLCCSCFYKRIMEYIWFVCFLMAKLNIYTNLYNLHLYLLIHLLYVLYSTLICHVGISAIEKQFIIIIIILVDGL